MVDKPTVEDLDREVTARSDVLIADAKRQEKAWVDFITDVIERHKHLPEHLVEAVLVRQFRRIEKETQ